jgi:chemotaxis protein methyltransferase CheR
MTKTEASIPTMPINSKMLRKCMGIYLSQARRVWGHLSPAVRDLPLGRRYARHLDRMVRLYGDRKQYFATFFLRNRPELQLLCRLVGARPYGSRIDLAVLACSKGAEVYSIAWAIRSARPDLELNISAVDISQEIVDFASRGVYSIERPATVFDEHDKNVEDTVVWNTSRDQNGWMFERMSSEEIDAMFAIEDNQASIRPYLRKGIKWMCGDATNARLNAAIGAQDIVFANRFLCHMKPEESAKCLRNIGEMIKPGGHLFVSGIDLDVRTKVSLEMGWHPVPDLLREIHDGDPSIRRGWPGEYWGLEPLDDRRPDWLARYASVFQVGDAPPCQSTFLAAEQAGR